MCLCVLVVLAFGAALDAYRRSNNSLQALTILQEMYSRGMAPAAAHINLVIRTLKSEVHSSTKSTLHMLSWPSICMC
jgi:pentatricopeptide repeat protein